MALADKEGNEIEHGQPVQRTRGVVAVGVVLPGISGRWWEQRPVKAAPPYTVTEAAKTPDAELLRRRFAAADPAEVPDAEWLQKRRDFDTTWGAAPRRPQWEYMTADLPATEDAANATARLNDLGYQGWELIMIAPNPKQRDNDWFVVAWFKRLRLPDRDGV